MIKILHTGDIHLGDLAGPTKDGANLRRQDTLRCMDAIVNKARTEGPTVTIIAGDLFNRSRVWADTALDDVNDAISRFIVPLCEYSDAVVLLFGTMNHDNPRAFEVIRKATPDLEYSDRGGIVVKDDTVTTMKDGVFAGGDAVTGAATVILAMGAGRRAARAIDEYIRTR